MTLGSTATPDMGLSPEARITVAEALDRPTKRDETWRYAPHNVLARLAFGPAPAEPPDLPAGIELDVPESTGPRIVLVNGVFDRARSDLGNLPAGLAVGSLADVTSDPGASPPEPVVAHFHSGTDSPSDAFMALNSAYGLGGTFVDVAAGARLDAPIHVVDITGGSAADIAGGEAGGEAAHGTAVPETALRNMTCSGVVIRIGDGAAATVVETRIGVGGSFGGSSTRTTITLGVDATLDHIVLQDLPAGQVHLGSVDVTQAAGSELRARSFNLGGSYGRLATTVRLAGEGARVDLAGLYFGTGDQILDQQVQVIHGARDCASRQSFRGVLDGTSTGVFNGGIEVRPGADGTDAAQSNDNLLLSDRAEANTQPRLEILADDVACKHGATVGRLDDTALYYLRSRGIRLEAARRLLISGFADQVVELVGVESVRSWITRRLGGTDA